MAVNMSPIQQVPNWTCYGYGLELGQCCPTFLGMRAIFVSANRAACSKLYTGE